MVNAMNELLDDLKPINATTHGQGFINPAYQMVTQVIEETKAEFQKKYSF